MCTEKVAVPLVTSEGMKNYASLDCGAKIVANNEQAQVRGLVDTEGPVW